MVHTLIVNVMECLSIEYFQKVLLESKDLKYVYLISHKMNLPETLKYLENGERVTPKNPNDFATLAEASGVKVTIIESNIPFLLEMKLRRSVGFVGRDPRPFIAAYIAMTNNKIPIYYYDEDAQPVDFMEDLSSVPNEYEVANSIQMLCFDYLVGYIMTGKSFVPPYSTKVKNLGITTNKVDLIWEKTQEVYAESDYVETKYDKLERSIEMFKRHELDNERIFAFRNMFKFCIRYYTGVVAPIRGAIVSYLPWWYSYAYAPKNLRDGEAVDLRKMHHPFFHYSSVYSWNASMIPAFLSATTGVMHPVVKPYPFMNITWKRLLIDPTTPLQTIRQGPCTSLLDTTEEEFYSNLCEHLSLSQPQA